MPRRSNNVIRTTAEQVAAAEERADRLASQEQRFYEAGDLTWQTHAGCRDSDPDMFHPNTINDPSIPEAIAVCLTRCPVIAACRARRYELAAPGVWGGVLYGRATGVERRCNTEGCSRPVKSQRAHYCGFEHEHAAKIGTYGGYKLHRQAKVPVCTACSEGYAEGALQYRNPGASARGTRTPRTKATAKS